MADDPAATAASNNPALSTLVTAVTAAGLVDTLNSDGPFTIFAPANEAFAKIPPADLEAVLADKDLLTSILTLHVVAGEQLERRPRRGAVGDHGQRRRHHVAEDGRHASRSTAAGDGRLRRRPDGQRHGAHHRCGADAAGLISPVTGRAFRQRGGPALLRVRDGCGLARRFTTGGIWRSGRSEPPS